MINKLFDFYKEELSMRNMIFSNMKLWYYFLKAVPLILPMLTLFVFYIKKPISPGSFFCIFFGSLVLPLGILIYFFNKKAKKEIMILYGINSNKWYWSSIEVINKIEKESKNKLLTEIKENHSFVDSNHIKELAEMVNKRANEIKYKFPIQVATLIALFIPLWNNFLSWLFDENLLLADGIYYFIVINFLGFLIVLPIIIIKKIINDEFSNKDFNRMKELEELLYDIYVDCKNEEQDKTSKEAEITILLCSN